MDAHAHGPVSGRTNWRRFTVMGLTSLAIAAVILVGTGEGALGASFAVSGQQFKVSADQLDGTGFVNYGWIDAHADGSAEPVAVASMRHATMRHMCQSVLTSLPIVG